MNGALWSDHFSGGEISISFWVYDSSTSTFTQTFNSDNLENCYRYINIHAPHSNNIIYCDCGNDNTAPGYDRINKAFADTGRINRWVHWVFTKNNSGSPVQKIYFDGVLWHSGSPGTDPITHTPNSNNYWGKVGTQVMDGVRIYETELTDIGVSQLYRQENV